MIVCVFVCLSLCHSVCVCVCVKAVSYSTDPMDRLDGKLWGIVGGCQYEIFRHHRPYPGHREVVISHRTTSHQQQKS